jgi:hypothetical protein
MRHRPDGGEDGDADEQQPDGEGVRERKAGFGRERDGYGPAPSFGGGTDGPSGAGGSGSSGSGAPGPSGVSGTAGPGSGTAGWTGASGTAGVLGISGLVGTSSTGLMTTPR